MTDHGRNGVGVVTPPRGPAPPVANGIAERGGTSAPNLNPSPQGPVNLKEQMRATYEQASSEIRTVGESAKTLEELNAQHAQNIEALLGELISVRSNGVAAKAATPTEREPILTANLVASVLVALLAGGGVAVTTELSTAVDQLVASGVVLAPIVINLIAGLAARRKATWVPTRTVRR